MKSPTSIRLAVESYETIRLVARILWYDFNIANLAESVKQHGQVAFGQVGRNVTDEHAVVDHFTADSCRRYRPSRA